MDIRKVCQFSCTVQLVPWLS
uniref:Uncharacterized protein n=1 Tax=Arundo donax TaxID=35708 RepID=A0A0A8Z5X3_ARUDO